VDDPGSTLRVEVLGPLRVLVGGLPVEVPGPKRRAVLALLALAEGRAVGTPTSPDCAHTSDRPRPACRPATADTDWTSLPTAWT
jgi:hypothetical protein